MQAKRGSQNLYVTCILSASHVTIPSSTHTMPKAPKTTQSLVDDTKQYHCDCEKLCKSQLHEVPYGTWRWHAEFRGPNTKGTHSLKEKRTHAGIAISAAQCASRGQSTSNTSDIRRSLSLDQDPQPVQQDEQNYDSDIEVRLAVLVLCLTMT